MAAPAGSSPFAIPLFRALWIATVASNIGSWMKDVGAAWLMTSMSPSPLMVALVQTASTLPMALLALPAGALADVIDRRKLLLAAQLWATGTSAALFVLTLVGSMGSYSLLALTFATACGSAVSAPAYQALISELVPRPILPQAVALGGMGVNVSRAIGPAIGGLLVAITGPAWVFLINALSFVGTIVVLWRWRRVQSPNRYPPEHLVRAIESGFRYVRRSSELRAVLVRTLGFFLFASAVWSLLPIFVRHELGLGPIGYGVLLGCIGCGAIGGAFSISPLSRRISSNGLTITAALALAAAMAALSRAPSIVFAVPCAALFGIAWILMMANIQAAAQLNAPAWVNARVLGMFLLVFQGSMAVGSALWGKVAEVAGTRGTLLFAAISLAIAQLLALRFRLIIDPSRDLTPSRHWPEPVLAQALKGDEGPVLVSIEYQIDPGRSAEFIEALYQLRAVRLRDGAMQWSFWQDASDPSRILEEFKVASWLEHLRQHERVTNADRERQNEIARFHVNEDPPMVRHWLAAK